MKWEPEFWEQANQQTGIHKEQLATLGDNICDDYEVPCSTGIGHAFIINRYQDLSVQSSDKVTFVRHFNQVVEYLTS